MNENQTPGHAYTWPTYQGTKQLKAHPMTKAAYCELRGRTVPTDEDPAEAGYCVVYQDGGKLNVDGFAGYVSWSPADVFEKAYRPCGSHVERMEIELEELHERSGKLADSIDSSPIFAKLDQTTKLLLSGQLSAMLSYSSILQVRLADERERANG